MAMDYRADSPRILLEFLSYHETVKAHSQKTVDEYYLDLRNFLRYIKQLREPELSGYELDQIDIRDIGIEFIRSITLTDVYSYLAYLSRERPQRPNSENSAKGLSAASRARKVATLRSFFNYLCNKVHLLPENPIRDIDSPKIKKSLPHYLTLDESIQLLENVDGPNRERDLCILTFFLNCGLRISELIGLNRSDIQDDALRVLGKGNKVRIVYLNESCKDALDRTQPGKKTPGRRRVGQPDVVRTPAAPYRCYSHAAKRRGCEGCAGGFGARTPEYHGDLYAY